MLQGWVKRTELRTGPRKWAERKRTLQTVSSLECILNSLAGSLQSHPTCSFWTETNNLDAVNFFIKWVLDFPWLAKLVSLFLVPMSFSLVCSRISYASCQPPSPSFFEKNFQKILGVVTKWFFISSSLQMSRRDTMDLLRWSKFGSFFLGIWAHLENSHMSQIEGGKHSLLKLAVSSKVWN